MKEKWDELEALFTEDGEISTREFCLIVAVSFLLGLVLGMLFSPKKHVSIASGNHLISCDDEDDEDEDK